MIARKVMVIIPALLIRNYFIWHDSVALIAAGSFQCTDLKSSFSGSCFGFGARVEDVDAEKTGMDSDVRSRETVSAAKVETSNDI